MLTWPIDRRTLRSFKWQITVDVHVRFCELILTTCIKEGRGTIKRGDFCACLQISVDLSQAFDTAPWELIHEIPEAHESTPSFD